MMISVVIPYYHEEVWKECIESVKKFVPTPYELIVSDCRGNGFDPSFHKYIYHRLHFRVGYTRSTNFGIKISCGEKVMLLNADAVLTAGCVEELDRILSLDPKIGMVGARAFSQGAYVGPIEHDLYSRKYGIIADYPDCCQVYMLNTECVLIRREMINDIGLMDEDHFWHDGSDLEYSLRAVKRGWKLMFAKNTTIYHDHGRYKKTPEQEKVKKILNLLVNPNDFIEVREL